MVVWGWMGAGVGKVVNFLHKFMVSIERLALREAEKNRAKQSGP
jgi:hypothetical protein